MSCPTQSVEKAVMAVLADENMRKKKNQTTTDYSKLMRVVPTYFTIKEVEEHKDLNTENIQSLKDKGLEGYLNKTVFKQQQYELPKSDNVESEVIKFDYVKTYSDATSYYNMRGMEGWTVKQFTDWVLEQNKWNGQIEIWYEPFECKSSYIRFQVLYSYDKDKFVDIPERISRELVEPNPDKYLNREIASASMIDGWNDQRDFHISLKQEHNYEFSF